MKHGGINCPESESQNCKTETCPPSEESNQTLTTNPVEITSYYTTTDLETTPSFPLDETEKVVADVLQSLGCTFIIGSLTLTLIIFLMLRDFSYERFIQMNMEIALLLAHILILTMRSKTEWPVPCKLVSITLQFAFLASFAFLTFEALQSYVILTNVIQLGGYFNRRTFFTLGWGMAGVITGFTAMFRHSDYPSTWSCWANVENSVMLATAAPIAVLCAITVVLAEAAGMGNHPPLLGTNKDQLSAAIVNTKGILFIMPLSVSSWWCGLIAVFYPNLVWYSLVAGLNMGLGVSLFLHHALGNPTVHAMVKKLFSRITGR